MYILLYTFTITHNKNDKIVTKILFHIYLILYN